MSYCNVCGERWDRHGTICVRQQTNAEMSAQNQLQALADAYERWQFLLANSLNTEEQLDAFNRMCDLLDALEGTDG